MYLDYFGLSDPPFQVTPNPRYIFLSRSHKEAFAHLLYGLEQQAGFILLTGEIGTGKTTVLRTLLHQLDENRYTCALIVNPCQTADELLHALLREFGLGPGSGSVAAMRDQLSDYLLGVRRGGGTAVLIIDEAQNLPLPVLEQVRQLSNLETETEKLIQIVLVGQPELGIMLQQENLRQLRQRIAVSAELTPLDQTESAEYLRHRLRIAGWQGGELFEPEAMKVLIAGAGGFPRALNLLADRSLLVAYTEQGNMVTRAHVEQAIAEREGKRSRRPGIILPVLVVALCALAGFGAARLTDSPARSNVPAPVQREVLPFSSERAALESILKRTGAEWPERLREELPLERVLQLKYPAVLSIPKEEGGGFIIIDGSDGEVCFGRSAEGEELRLSKSLLSKSRYRVVIPWANPEQLPDILGPGGTGASVARLQGLLNQLGNTLNGSRYDERTRSAVASVQRSHELPSDGIVGPQTLMLLYRLTGEVNTVWREK